MTPERQEILDAALATISVRERSTCIPWAVIECPKCHARQSYDSKLKFKEKDFYDPEV